MTAAQSSISQPGTEKVWPTPPLGQRGAQEKDAQKFLPVLGPVEEGHSARPGQLAPAAEGEGGVQALQQTAAQAAHPPAQRHGEDQSQEYPSPGSSPDVVQPAGQGQGGPGEPGHQGMALTGGHPEAPGQDGPKDNGAQRRAESGESRGPVRAEVSDGVDGPRYCCVDCRHDEDAQQVACRRQRDRPPKGENSR